MPLHKPHLLQTMFAKIPILLDQSPRSYADVRNPPWRAHSWKCIVWRPLSPLLLLNVGRRMMTDPPKHRRRWWQLSLRTLLIVVTVFCILLGITVKRARDQRQAVEAIEALGGKTHYRHDNHIYSSRLGPAWLRRLIGNNYFITELLHFAKSTPVGT